jgi:rhodanese-related sulfurtransferase
MKYLAAVALLLGALAVVAGSSKRGASALDVAALARTVETEEDHVTAIELARWIRDRKPDLRVIDVRDSAEFEEYHVPTAERMSLDRIANRPFKQNETIVLYSGGGAHAAQGWVFLKALGYQTVYFLRGGVSEWLDEVMNPRFPAKASATDREQMDSVAALSKYFGGVPRESDSASASQSWQATVKKVRGRGC